ncbi:hypothetical protein I3842_02G147700 [Carya illinoinensis]|uniref:Protein FAR1-RELATED SEQUENCE n=1 Tax=Carya illinoinensis TaxID=32201 RepID=A0A922K619_CARIL|nr:hypothetical protein I3842_02G147700 [Carya illinoinensis]
MKNFGWSSDSDDVEILTSRNFPTEEETVEEQCNVNLEDGDGDNVEDGENGEDGDGVNLISTSSSGLFEPFIGKEFDEVEDAQAFYKAYARKKGFAMRTNHTQLSRGEKKLIGVHYVCTREGFRRESLKQNERKNPELAETKIGCKATMCIKKNGERWILLTPRSTSLLRGHRGVTRVQKKLILTLNESEAGGDFKIGCIGKDVENYLGNKRRKFFEEEDAQRLYAYFLERQCKEPGMGSCFWADARSRSAYQYFGDVVTFNATYLTNVYKMSFVLFSGVNHHHQTIMFGCALLEAMLGRAPSTIITDDDKAMAKAIAVVLPNTNHRLCLWHILQKFPEHLAHVYKKISRLSKRDEWVSILVKYGLACNDWMQNLYNQREKWVPAYLRTTFCAGMSTTQRSESMNKFFKNYVRSSTMVSDFVHQYEKASSARYFKEKEKDVRTKSSNPASKVYTRKSFNIFQEELFNCQRYKMTKVQQDEESKMYEVAPNGKDGQIYYVTLDSRGGTQAIYTCHKFEFLGILCRHILCVFMKKSNLDMLPYHYVLERWTINAKSRAILEIPNSEGPFPTQEDPILRKSHLMMQFYDIVELGSQSRFKMNHLSLALDKVHKELLSMEDIGEQNLEAGDMSLKKWRYDICKVEGHTRNNCPSLGDIGNINDNISQRVDLE